MMIRYLLASLAALELALRLFYPLGRPIHQKSDELFFTLIPNATTATRLLPENGGGSISYHVNRDGFRGAELRSESGLRRIVVYGDSFIDAYHTRDERTFVRRIEQGLQSALGPSLEVVNAGTAANGADIDFLKMMREIPKLRPERVVLAINSRNAFGSLLSNRRFKLSPSGELQGTSSRVRELALKDVVELPDQPSDFWGHSQIIRTLRYFRARHTSPQIDYWRKLKQNWDHAALFNEHLRVDKATYEDFMAERESGPRPLGDYTVDLDVAVTPKAPGVKYKKALLAKVLLAMRDSLAANGIPLTLLVIPWVNNVCDGAPELGLVKETGRGKLPDYPKGAMTDAVMRIAKDAGIPALDLYPIFRAHAPCDLYFRFLDDHWNDAGQELAAREFAKFYLAQSQR